MVHDSDIMMQPWMDVHDDWFNHVFEIMVTQIDGPELTQI